jgi:hypothetical protein
MHINRWRDKPRGTRPYSQNRFPRKITDEHTCIERDQEKKEKKALRCAHRRAWHSAGPCIHAWA